MNPREVPGRVIGRVLSLGVDVAIALVLTPLRWWDDTQQRLGDPHELDPDEPDSEIAELRAEWRKPRGPVAPPYPLHVPFDLAPAAELRAVEDHYSSYLCPCATPGHAPNCPRAAR